MDQKLCRFNDSQESKSVPPGLSPDNADDIWHKVRKLGDAEPVGFLPLYSRWRMNVYSGVVQRLEKLSGRLQATDGSDVCQFIFDLADRDRLAGTCEWFLLRAEFHTWIAKDCKKPILWLNGEQGTGKTTLCAAAIRYLLSSDNTTKARGGDSLSISPEPPFEPAIIHHFLSRNNSVKFKSLLQSLARRLVEFLIKRESGQVPSYIEPFLSRQYLSLRMTQDLVRTILEAIPLTFIFIDGLDEVKCASVSAPHGSSSSSEVEKLVGFLVQEVLDHPSRVRLWLSSQAILDIQVHTLLASRSDGITEMRLTTQDTREDLETYVTHHMQSVTNDGGGDIKLRQALFRLDTGN